MADERFEDHLRWPRRRDHVPDGAARGTAGGAACGDLVRIDVRVEGGVVADTGFAASGCGAAQAAASAAVELAHGRPVLDVARVGTDAVAAELGGLTPGKRHAADLAADALHVALGTAVAATGALAPAPDRVLVAMSSGVDSTVAALLEQRAGREVVGVTLELWRSPENDAEGSCCSLSAVRAARAQAHRAGLPHLTLDLREPFRAGVVEPFLADHAAALTPNPCVRCNGHVRLDAMLDLADRLGAGAGLATGHYARVGDDGLLRPALDAAKDQTYMLAGLRPASLARLRFPLGALRKSDVRAIAGEAGLPVAAKPDSQDLCFLAGTGKAAFLARHGGLRDREGAIVDAAGRELGRHRGVHHVTVGQRRGVGVDGAGVPLHVLRVDPERDEVVVGPREALATDRVRVGGVRLHRGADAVAQVKLRYRSAPVPCRLSAGDGVVELLEPVDGAAPGQTAVFLGEDDAVVGSATIRR